MMCMSSGAVRGRSVGLGWNGKAMYHHQLMMEHGLASGKYPLPHHLQLLLQPLRHVAVAVACPPQPPPPPPQPPPPMPLASVVLVTLPRGRSALGSKPQPSYPTAICNNEYTCKLHRDMYLFVNTDDANQKCGSKRVVTNQRTVRVFVLGASQELLG